MRTRNQPKEYAALKVWRANNPDKFKESLRRYYANHRDEIRAKQALRYAANPERHRGYERKRLYGLSPAEYLSMLKGQGHKCAACCVAFSRDNRPYVDHCHTTGRVRGILCQSCNTGL